ncbi:MAG: FG-GAP repeat protein [Chloroflexi bacterium]|nr:FG-GAP repeat protein [Chloroflexota bacterium]
MNSDGFADLAIGVLQADPGGRGTAGEAYVMFGPLGKGTFEISTEADNILNGIATGDRLGSGLAISDVKNDGFTGLVIGAVQMDVPERTKAGLDLHRIQAPEERYPGHFAYRYHHPRRQLL